MPPRILTRVPRHIATLLFAPLLLVGDAAGQGSITAVRSDHAIEAESVFSTAPLTEPFVLVNSDDPNHVLVVAIVAPVNDDSPWHCAALVSLDGGDSWTRTDFPMERCIDPWLAWAPNGDVLFVGIELLREVEGDERFHLVSFRSGDGGRTWSSRPNSLGRAHEHAMLFLQRNRDCGRNCSPNARATTPPGDAVYVTSRRMRRTPNGQPRHTVYVARSEDDGESFVDVAELSPSNLALNVTGMVFPGRNVLAVSFWDFQRNKDGFGRDGMLHRSRAWLYVSQDGGDTFGAPRFITDDCASGVEGSFPGYPALASDTSSGPFHGRLYHACVRPNFDGITLTHSADNGEVWSDPVRVDAPPCRDRVTCTSSNVRTPMLAVNKHGIVGIAWYDRRHDPQGECQDFYFTVSVDGGATVLQPTRVSRQTSCNASAQNGRAGRSWPLGGDYSSFAADSAGRFHLVWADSRSGRFELRHAVLSREP